jgi:spore coat protein U-like protein
MPLQNHKQRNLLRRRHLTWTGVLALMLISGTAQAVNCRSTITPLDFGIYDPGLATPLDVTGNLDLRCAGNAGSFMVTISTGANGSVSLRQLASGPYRMQYNLFIDPARSLIWGDGTGGTSVITGSKPANGPPVFFSYPIYARIFPRQNVSPGLYADSLLVTVIF